MEPEPSAIQPKLAVIQEARFAQSAPGEDSCNKCLGVGGGRGLLYKYYQNFVCTPKNP